MGNVNCWTRRTCYRSDKPTPTLPELCGNPIVSKSEDDNLIGIAEGKKILQG